MQDTLRFEHGIIIRCEGNIGICQVHLRRLHLVYRLKYSLEATWPSTYRYGPLSDERSLSLSPVVEGVSFSEEAVCGGGF